MIFIGKESILFYEFNDLSTFSRTINKPMELGVDIIRSKLLIVSLFMITMYFWLLPIFAHAVSRGISVISDLSHQSGKLGAYKALIIGINYYKDTNIPDLETSVNDANAMANLLRQRYGFEVKLLLDHKATREAIYRALRSLASSTEAGDSVLIYYAGPDKSTNWNEAKRWVENLNVAGGNWRMPTRKEIKTLFKRGEGTRNMTPLLKTSGWWVWSRETQGSSSAWAFAFIGAGREILSTRNSSNDRRGFAVRLRRGE